MDPELELVGVYFSAILELTPAGVPIWNLDLFQNAVTAAIDD